jgi:hypothetical protein
MAYASVHQFTQALKTGGEAAMPVSDDVTVDATTHPQVAKAKKRNAIAMANLTMAFTSEMTMGLVYKAQTEEWPGGLAYLVVAALKAKYMPDDVITKVELRQMLAKVTMKKDDEPSILFEQLSAIENRFNKPGEQIPDDDLIAAVLTAAPKEYVSILTAEQRSKGVALRLTDLESAMTQHWRQTTGTLSVAEEGKEVTLLGFNGICYNCQKPGHRANECPEKANRNSGGRNNNNNNQNVSRGGRGRGNGGNKNYKFKGNCNNCGKQGHAEATCWMLPSNASKRPAWFKPREDGNETGTVATETGNKVEYLLMAMEFPTDQKFLDNPNVWIGDTGDSVHMSPHRNGMRDLQKAKSVDAITMANGSSEDATVIGDISGRACDKNGNVLNDAKITDVTHLPEGKYNLFSITKLQNEGWILNGDASAIWLTKGDIEIKFDIKIPTPKGVLYAMYHQRDT